MDTCNICPLCSELIWFWSCRCKKPGSLFAYRCTGLVTLEAVGIASATGIKETVAMLRFAIEMPLKLIAVAHAIVGCHVAPLFSRHFEIHNFVVGSISRFRVYDLCVFVVHVFCKNHRKFKRGEKKNLPLDRLVSLQRRWHSRSLKKLFSLPWQPPQLNS